MRYVIRIFLCVTVLLSFFASQVDVSAGSLPEPKAVCAYCGCPLPNGTHSPSCPYYKAASKSAKSKAASTKAELNAMIVETVFQSLLTSMFAEDAKNKQEALEAQQKAAALAAQQAAAQQKAQAAAAQAEYERMMKSYKQLDSSGGVAFKTLSDSSLAMKTLDGDEETLAANARKPFDTAGDLKLPPEDTTLNPTPFLGDTMPIEDIRLLVNPDNDPRVVDLRDAKTFVVENLKNDSDRLAESTRPYDGDGNGEPINQPPDCVKLANTLKGYINQRNKFEKTINLASEQYTTWKTANRNALLNAAKDGLEYFTGQLLDDLSQRGKVADRLESIYRKNASQMAKEGLDIADIEARIKRLKMISSAGQIAELTNNMSEWQTFMKDGLSSLVKQLTSSNNEIQEMFDDPRIQKYFQTESPELSTLLDISKIAAANKVFGKWVANKVPLIAGIELGIKQSYNALDWYLSFTHIIEANRINGEVMYAARSLQKHIDDTYLALRECP